MRNAINCFAPKGGGWLRTGDIIEIMDNGEITVVDRKEGDHHYRWRQEHRALR